MAKTVKRETKNKTSNKKIVEKKEIITNENDNLVEINDDEPKLVNEKNEIIYDPEDELKKFLEKVEPNIPTDFIEDDVKEGLDFIKNSLSYPTDLGNDINKNVEYAEKQIEELIKIKDNIIKNSNKSNFNFTSYWNGITNKW